MGAKKFDESIEQKNREKKRFSIGKLEMRKKSIASIAKVLFDV